MPRFGYPPQGAGLSSVLTIGGQLLRPGINLYESWQDETGIDPAVWTVTDPVAGTAWARGAVGELLMASVAPNASLSARLRSNQRWVVSPGLYSPSRILRKFNLEFEMHIVNLLANLDPVTFFLGLTAGIADVRTVDNIMGWALQVVGGINKLQSLTDAGSAEVTNTGFGENFTLTNKLKMEISYNSCKFYLNEVLKATHITNLPDAPFYINFFIPTNAGGAATFRLGTVRAWLEDVS